MTIKLSIASSAARLLMAGLVMVPAVSAQLAAQEAAQIDLQSMSLEQARAYGAQHSLFLNEEENTENDGLAREPDLSGFNTAILPLLKKSCYPCHGDPSEFPDALDDSFRIDQLDPNLVAGQDATWWMEVLNVVSNGEMPPAEAIALEDAERVAIVQWLSTELKRASKHAANNESHSSFRRMTRYEFNYALQDLLGLEYEFARDLPPEAPSEDGFLNSSDRLQFTVSQLQTYREIARRALKKATVRDSQPTPVYYSIQMDFGIEKARERFARDKRKLEERHADDPVALAEALQKRQSANLKKSHFRDLNTGFVTEARWSYGGAKYARSPVTDKPTDPTAALPTVAVLPVGQRLVIELGDHLPDEGTLQLRVRASRSQNKTDSARLRLKFGHQASNNSFAEERVGTRDLVIDAPHSMPAYYTLHIPLGEVVRNPFRGIQPLGKTPNPSEYLSLQNTSRAPIDIQIDYGEVIAPFYASWPPASHLRVFPERHENESERDYARRVIQGFMARAWRRQPSDAELKRKLVLFERIIGASESQQDALLEVLATVLSSPNFLYLPTPSGAANDQTLASRLAILLWSSLPDEELMRAADDGLLSDESALRSQLTRMLNDPRASRFASHFVSQWLGLDALTHAQVNEDLRRAMQTEPIALFQEVLTNNASIMDLLHADYTVINEQLGNYYQVPRLHGQQFRKVELPSDSARGGLLTMPGIMAMNSDGKDSHPLKRGIWLLERVLNDPPPPPPPSVPEIDLTDPDILKLTLKERMEDHRNDPACNSCHQRIDPWGIAFENFDARGAWRSMIDDQPVDSKSSLFNGEPLDGVVGLKRYLLATRQDQFAGALTHKMAAYALGRPIAFTDQAELDRITEELRRRGDGLQTLLQLIVTSDLFRLGAEGSAPEKSHP